MILNPALFQFSLTCVLRYTRLPGKNWFIDEYDKPIIDHIDHGDEHLRIAEENRSVQKRLFGILKDANVVGAVEFLTKFIDLCAQEHEFLIARQSEYMIK
ncbi:hypothetical protein QUF75_00440 [Desulfococcaceae bacterium HSG7]|nr:hypothetical protein [Desulfococcaceae bacterium HSG7]